MLKPSLIEFASPQHMADKVADVMAAQLGSAVAARGKAVFAVSGGSTPKLLHEALSARDLPWRDVTTVLVDERWVAPGEAGSNETFVLETLRRNKAAHVPVVGLYRPTRTPQEAFAAVAAAVSQAGPSIDVLHLGLGLDGHTASWFPHADGLDAALAPGAGRVAAITAKQSAVTGALTARMTLTLDAVKSAKHIYLMLTGANKRAAFEAALDDGPVEHMPVRAILAARPDMWICWAP